MRWKSIRVAALLCLVMGAVHAADIRQGSQCDVAAGETIDGNLFVVCRMLRVDGHITGNLIGMATGAVITGRVDGDIYLLAGEMEMRGAVGDDIHFAGSQMQLHEDARLGDAHSDLLTLSLSTEIMPGAQLPGSLSAAGYQVRVDGTVDGELQFWGAALAINGAVGGAVDAQVGDSRVDISQWQTLFDLLVNVPLLNPGLRVGEGARVEGALTYSSQSEGALAEGALAAPARYIPIIPQPDFSQIAGQQDESRGLSSYLTQVAREFIALSIIGVIGLLLLPRPLQAPLDHLRARPLPSLVVGALGSVGLVIAATLFVLLTIIAVLLIGALQINELTLTVAAILGIVDVGGTGLLVFALMFISRVVVCLALGGLIFQFAAGGRKLNLFAQLIAGVALLALVVALPLVGALAQWAAIFLGVGAMVLTTQARIDHLRESASPMPAYVAVNPPLLARPGDDPRPAPPPPPIINDERRPLGMDNLPEGFRWWDNE